MVLKLPKMGIKPQQVNEGDTSLENKKISSIFEMMDLLVCVCCSKLPEKVWTPGACCHKYCQACLEKLALKECLICQANVDPKERQVDLLSSKLITHLLELLRTVDPDATYSAKSRERSDSVSATGSVTGEVKSANKSQKSVLGEANQDTLSSEEVRSGSVTKKTKSQEINNNSLSRNKKGKEKKKSTQGADLKATSEVSKEKSVSKSPFQEPVITGSQLVKLFGLSDSEGEEEELPKLTPHQSIIINKSQEKASKPSPAVEKIPPVLDVQAKASSVSSPVTRKQSKQNNISRRSLESEFDDIEADIPTQQLLKKLPVQKKPEPPTFIKPKPKVQIDPPRKFFSSRPRSSSRSSDTGTEDDNSSANSTLKAPIRSSPRKRKAALKSSSEPKKSFDARGSSGSDEPTKKGSSKPARPSSSMDSDVFDFQSQSKKPVKAKARKGRMRLDSSSSNASVSSKASTKESTKNSKGRSAKTAKIADIEQEFSEELKILSGPKTSRGKTSSRAGSVAESESRSDMSFKISPGSSLNKRNQKGETSLHVAVRNGKVEKIKELIAAGADVDIKDFAQWAPLHEAIASKHPSLEIVKILVEASCDVNALGFANETPLHEASRNGLSDIISYLLEQSASPFIRNNKGKLPKDVTKNKEIKALFEDFEEQTVDQSQSNAVSVELKVSLQKAIFYFACDMPKDILKKAKHMLDMKISSELTKEVTHVIFDAKANSKITLTFDFLLAILNGCWILSSSWVTDSLSVSRALDPRKYQLGGCIYDNIPSSTGVDKAVEKARVNREVGHPGLFKGMNFYIYKSTGWPPNVKGGKSSLSLSKKDIGKLIQFGDGVVINREPDPEYVDPLDYPARFHAIQDHPDNKLVMTSHLVLFDEKNVPPNQYDFEHLKTLKIDWLIHSAVHFKLLHPDSYL